MGSLAARSNWARLSFWVRPEHLVEFNWIYAHKLTPLLARHNLVEQKYCQAPAAEGVCSHFFLVAGPEEVAIRGNELQRDPQWVGWWRKLGEDFGVWGESYMLKYRWEIYQTAAGPGTTTVLGAGNRQGMWQCFGLREGLPSADITVQFRDLQGCLWFGTWGGGVCRYDGTKLTTFRAVDGLICDQVSAIAEDREGRLWFGTEEGVSRYDGQTFQTFTSADGLPADRIAAIAEDQEGGLWFGTEAGASRYDGEQFQTFTHTDGQPDKGVTVIAQDQQGKMWFGTWGGGLFFHDGQSFGCLTTEDGLICNEISDIAADGRGTLWLATAEGVAGYDGKSFTTLVTRESLSDDIPTVLLVDVTHKLWIGTNLGGVSCWDGERFADFSAEEGLPSNTVIGLEKDCGGRVWLSALGGGICRYDGEHVATFTAQQGLASDRVTSLLEDRAGRLWFGTWGGVCRREGNQYVNLRVGQGLVGNRVRAMLEDRQGHLWFGTWGGVSCYDGKRFANFSTAHGLAHNVVTSIFQDRKGCLWFGTWGGVSCYDGKEFVNLTTAQGLSYNVITSILQDREGSLWFGTWGNGVSRYDGKVFQVLCHQDGLAHDAVHGILQDQRGDFWIATEGGVTHYRPQHRPPTVAITQVVTSGCQGAVSEVRLSCHKPIVFEFQGSSWTTRPDGMAYVYRLAGHQEDWRAVYGRRVEYEGPGPGEYTFEVMAVDRDLNYSAAPAQVKVMVEPYSLPNELGMGVGAGRGEELVGTSAALSQVQRQLAQVSETDMALLILGETGTGKGLIARTVHRVSLRKEGPFVTVNCGALPDRLVESELFGHEKGAFTGAYSRKLGKVELAKGGTLFLDEIGDLPLDSQTKLLRLLEEYTFDRVGGTQSLRADVRIIAATNRDLGLMVAAGSFRPDLYYRLPVFVVQLPPLRERQKDISLLAAYFMEKMAEHLGKRLTHFGAEAMALLEGYSWPGNVRELQHVVERAVVVCSGPEIRVQHIALSMGSAAASPEEVAALVVRFPGSAGELVTLEEAERRYITQVLEQTGWVIAGSNGATEILGLPESTLRHRIRKLVIKRW